MIQQLFLVDEVGEQCAGSNPRAPGDLRRRRAEPDLGNLVHRRLEDCVAFLRTSDACHSCRREYSGSALAVTAMMFLQSRASVRQFRGARIDELHPMELILIWRDGFQCFGASRRDRSRRSASGQQSSMVSKGTIGGSIRVAVRVGLVTMKTPEIL